MFMNFFPTLLLGLFNYTWSWTFQSVLFLYLKILIVFLFGFITMVNQIDDFIY